MTDEEDEYRPRPAHEIPEWELEEMIRMAIEQGLRPDIAKRALEWLDRKLGTKH
jgi:PHP family Zn ribbon phosphoesterase